MTGPREWRHAQDCAAGWPHTATCWYPSIRCQDGLHPCACGLSAVRDAIAAGHRVVIGPDGVEGRLIGTWLAGDYEIVPLKEP